MTRRRDRERRGKVPGKGGCACLAPEVGVADPLVVLLVGPGKCHR